MAERNADLTEWEEHLRQEVEADETIGDTQKTQIVLARRGQGIFKENVRKLEKRCRITGVERLEHLRASHPCRYRLARQLHDRRPKWGRDHVGWRLADYR